MKIVALSAALLFAGSPVVASICVLHCAGPAQRAAASAPHSHCGGGSTSPEDPKREPCGHGHRGETLISSSTGPKVVPPPSSTFEPSDSNAAWLAVARSRAARPTVFESPPSRSSPSVLRL